MSLGKSLENQNLKEYSENYSIELGILTQDIPLPEITKKGKHPLTHNILKSVFENKNYRLAEQYYGNALGTFYVPVLFPLVEEGEPVQLEFDAPKNKTINDTLVGKNYIESNYVQLVIPKHIVMDFYGQDKIPAGTKFLLGFIGGANTYGNFCVIGVYGQNLPITLETGED